jgi:ABC-type phosphate transport system permease subunit
VAESYRPWRSATAQACPLLGGRLPSQGQASSTTPWQLRRRTGFAVASAAVRWAGEAKAEFKTALAPAAIIVLMAITFLCNGVAVFLRNRYDKRW